MTSHSQVAHIWAQGNVASRKGANVFFERNTIYSYGYHFPMGVLLQTEKGRFAALNSSSYSVSTSKQQGYVRNAVNHLERVYLPTHLIKLLSNIGDEFLPTKKMLEAPLHQWLSESAINAATSAAKRRKPDLIAGDIRGALSHFESARRLMWFYGMKLSAKTESLATALQEDFNSVATKHANQLLAEKRKQDKARKVFEAERMVKALEAKPLWLNGDDTYSIQSLMRTIPAMLRVKEDIIETSHGAQFPVDHAKRAFMFIRNLHDKAVAWHRTDDTGQAMTIGHFRIDKIDEQGNVTAGCHFVEWQYIEHVARILKIYP